MPGVRGRVIEIEICSRSHCSLPSRAWLKTSVAREAPKNNCLCRVGNPGASRLSFRATPIASPPFRATALRKCQSLSVPGLASPMDCRASLSQRWQLLGWKPAARMPPWAIPATLSKAWACLRTNTFVHRSDDKTTNVRADLMVSRRCIVVWPAHLVSQSIKA